MYRTSVSASIPDGVPQAAADAARDTLGGALAVAHQLPGEAGQSLFDAATDAFTQGLNLSAGVGAVIALAMAMLVLTSLRNARTGSNHDDLVETVEASEPRIDAVLEPACAD